MSYLLKIATEAHDDWRSRVKDRLVNRYTGAGVAAGSLYGLASGVHRGFEAVGAPVRAKAGIPGTDYDIGRMVYGELANNPAHADNPRHAKTLTTLAKHGIKGVVRYGAGGLAIGAGAYGIRSALAGKGNVYDSTN